MPFHCSLIFPCIRTTVPECERVCAWGYVARGKQHRTQSCLGHGFGFLTEHIFNHDAPSSCAWGCYPLRVICILAIKTAVVHIVWRFRRRHLKDNGGYNCVANHKAIAVCMLYACSMIQELCSTCVTCMCCKLAACVLHSCACQLDVCRICVACVCTYGTCFAYLLGARCWLHVGCMLCLLSARLFMCCLLAWCLRVASSVIVCKYALEDFWTFSDWLA